MANIKTLKDLTPGTVFDAGPIDVRVLDHMTNGTTLLIADKAVAWRPFSLEPMKTRPEEAPTPYPNDFSLSYLKDELNGPFLAAFDTAGGPIRSANIVTADWSLADHRGGFGYGNMKAKISLLPEALFLKYKALLALDDWWWLVTPYAGGASNARYVSSGGGLSYDRIEITVPKGNREIIAQAAAAAGMSVNAFIKEAIEAQIAKQSA